MVLARGSATDSAGDEDMAHYRRRDLLADELLRPARRASAFRVEGNRRHQVEREARPGEIVIDATQHQRAAQARCVPQELRASEPVRAQDAAIERLRGIVIAHLAAEGEAQVARPVCG